MKTKARSPANARIAENGLFEPVLVAVIFIVRSHVKLLTGIHTNEIVS